jgi:hypothetical protein
MQLKQHLRKQWEKAHLPSGLHTVGNAQAALAAAVSVSTRKTNCGALHAPSPGHMKGSLPAHGKSLLSLPKPGAVVKAATPNNRSQPPSQPRLPAHPHRGKEQGTTAGPPFPGRRKQYPRAYPNRNPLQDTDRNQKAKGFPKEGEGPWARLPPQYRSNRCKEHQHPVHGTRLTANSTVRLWVAAPQARPHTLPPEDCLGSLRAPTSMLTRPNPTRPQPTMLCASWNKHTGPNTTSLDTPTMNYYTYRHSTKPGNGKYHSHCHGQDGARPVQAPEETQYTG